MFKRTIFIVTAKRHDLNNIPAKETVHRPNRWGTLLDEMHIMHHPGNLCYLRS